MATEVENRTFQFGAFELDRSCGELRKNGVKISSGAASSDSYPPPGSAWRTSDPRRIRRGLWPNNTFVDFDNAINSAVWKIREALGDNSENPRFVQLSRHGDTVSLFPYPYETRLPEWRRSGEKNCQPGLPERLRTKPNNWVYPVRRYGNRS